MIVINTTATITTQHELESQQNHDHLIPSSNYLDIPTPQPILNGNRGSPSSTLDRIRSHSTMTADSKVHHHHHSVEKPHLSAPPSLISRNSLKGRRHVVAPIITLNNDQLDSNVDPLDFHFRQRFRHHHPSLTSSDYTYKSENHQKMDSSNYDMFVAFPWISKIGGLKMAIGFGTFSIALISGVIAYDFILFATGTNVFDIHRNT